MPLNLLLFFLNPILGLLSYSMTMLREKPKKEAVYKVFFALLALFLGFLNMTKIPENDLAAHAITYLESREYSFIGYLLYIGKEYVFYSLSYCFYYLTNGSIKLWVLTITFASYYIFFLAVYDFFKKFNASNSVVLFAIMITAFFPQLFSLSAHLIRQFLAASILVYFLVQKVIYERNCWYLPIVGVFIHSSTLLLFPLAYVPFLRNRLQLSNALYFALLASVLVFYQLVAQAALPIFSGNAALEYSLKRGSGDTITDLGSFQVINFVFVIIFSIILYTTIFIRRVGRILIGFDHFSNIIFVLVGFISTSGFFFLSLFQFFLKGLQMKLDSFYLLVS
jgi:hypothetical protein